MKLLRFSGKPRKLKDSLQQKQGRLGRILFRRVVGDSMLPTLRPGTIVVGYARFRNLQPRDIVIIRHGGLEKIKRVADIHENQVYLVGDNQVQSTDSRTFGWLPVSVVMAKVIWPRSR